MQKLEAYKPQHAELFTSEDNCKKSSLSVATAPNPQAETVSFQKEELKSNPQQALSLAVSMLEEHSEGLRKNVLCHYQNSGVSEAQPLIDPNLREYFTHSKLYPRMKSMLDNMTPDDQQLVYALLIAVDRGVRYARKNTEYNKYESLLRPTVEHYHSKKLPPDYHEVPGKSKRIHDNWMKTDGLRPNTSKTIQVTQQLADHAAAAILIDGWKMFLDQSAHRESDYKFACIKIRERERILSEKPQCPSHGDRHSFYENVPVDISTPEGNRVETDGSVIVNAENKKVLVSFNDFYLDKQRFAVCDQYPTGKPGIGMMVFDSKEDALLKWDSDEKLPIPELYEFQEKPYHTGKSTKELKTVEPSQQAIPQRNTQKIVAIAGLVGVMSLAYICNQWINTWDV